MRNITIGKKIKNVLHFVVSVTNDKTSTEFVLIFFKMVKKLAKYCQELV